MQAQEDRNAVLDAAAESGVVRDLTAWRQSTKGTRFQIRNAVLFNLETPTGNKVRLLCHLLSRSSVQLCHFVLLCIVAAA